MPRSTTQTAAPPGAAPALSAPPSGTGITSTRPPRRRAKKPLGVRLRKDWQMLVLMIPGALALLLFFYIPILGNVIAFQDYQPYFTVSEAPFVGLEKFVELFQDDRFALALRNTLVYAAFQLVLFFPLPILLALIVDSMMS